ncbi:uncharacterized protein LOC126251669 isoform X2 [Schistocerca nitens]|uniref:uncharacterized protein LOC126251669 isoform X2 n=1 Tax=Schistocerca nitens TaxID=7011 RepID=UPI00211778AE|nr:uncharacterized protein LOC126251669 isoform X2 [Schistocerca nitens]
MGTRRPARQVRQRFSQLSALTSDRRLAPNPRCCQQQQQQQQQLELVSTPRFVMNIHNLSYRLWLFFSRSQQHSQHMQLRRQNTA